MHRLKMWARILDLRKVIIFRTVNFSGNNRNSLPIFTTQKWWCESKFLEKTSPKSSIERKFNFFLLLSIGRYYSKYNRHWWSSMHFHTYRFYTNFKSKNYHQNLWWAILIHLLDLRFFLKFFARIVHHF